MLVNTVVTAYLPGGPAALAKAVEAWAASAGRPVLWLQWEPKDSSPTATRYAWTADAWSGAARLHTRIGTVHPHGSDVELAVELAGKLAQNYPFCVRFDNIH